MRTYIRSGFTVSNFFEELDQREVRYVVLRWFESLPTVDSGEDIDLLVADSDLEFIEECTDRRNKAGIPLDIYTPSGSNKTKRGQALVFPVTLSQAILDSRQQGNNGVWHPSHEMHFESLAFHVLFHKGHRAGLPAKGFEISKTPEHAYAELLGAMQTKLERTPVPISLEGLYEYFRASPWFPSADMLDILVRDNPWLASRWREEIKAQPLPFRNMSVFVIRELGMKLAEEFRRQIQRMGFHIVDSRVLGAREALALSSVSRGGNWGPGPFPVSGGAPGMVFVAVDPSPILPPPAETLEKPALYNFREFQTKLLIRKTFNKFVPRRKRANVVHSSDNGINAAAMCGIIYSKVEIKRMGRDAQAFLDSATPSILGAELIATGAKRSFVLRRSATNQSEIVKWFKPGMQEYMERELSIRKLFAGDDRIVAAKEVGDRWFAMEEVYGETLEGSSISATEVREIRSFVRDLRSRGVEAIDFFPRNVIRLESGELKFLDFEYFQIRKPTRRLKGAAAFYPVRSRYKFELPLDYRPDSYARRWRPVTKVPRWVMAADLPDCIVRVFQFLTPKAVRLNLIWRHLVNKGIRCLGNLVNWSRVKLRKYSRLFRRSFPIQ